MAFAVDDSEQARGIGTRLLEQLAARARDAGINRFVAEVMASNAAALAVFTDAGFELVRTARKRRGRAWLPRRHDRRIGVARRGTRPHRRRRLVAPLLRPGRGRRDRCVAPSWLDRRRALPQHPRSRLRRRRVPRQPQRGAGRRCTRLHVDRRDRGHGRPRRHLSARRARARRGSGRAAPRRAVHCA